MDRQANAPALYSHWTYSTIILVSTFVRPPLSEFRAEDRRIVAIMLDLPQTTILILLLLSLIWIASLVRVRFRPGLRSIPGPRLAAYSRFWNVKNAASGDSHKSFQRLHEKYGKVVRVGPNHVALSDPAMIPIIYGTNNRYLKVGKHVLVWFCGIDVLPSDKIL